jgi:hypothetical protein
MDRMNLLDIAKQTDPNGKPAQVIEILNEHSTMVADAPAYVANGITGNRVTLRSSLPVVDFTKINKGSTRSKGSYRQVVDSMGILDGLSEVDARERLIVGEEAFAAARWKEDAGFIESMAQTANLNLLYGDERVNEAAFTGFAPRMNKLNPDTITGSRVRSASGAGGDNTSMYVVDWGERACHLIYSKGATAGVSVKTLGEQRVTDGANKPFMAFCTNYLWVLGLSVEDPRRMARLANIDVSDIRTAGAAAYAGPDLVVHLTWLISGMPEVGGNQRVIYCHPDVYAAFSLIAMGGKNVNITVGEWLGKKTPYFNEYPIRKMDRISLSEPVVAP